MGGCSGRDSAVLRDYRVRSVMTRTSTEVALLYITFALFSTIVNIGAQIVTTWLYEGPFYVEISILVGTAVGLPLRYVLEKRYVFVYTSKNVVHDGQLFVVYSGMGVITTLVFWGVEYAFHLVYGSDLMRYLGGILGLSLGFYLKYQLDKKYVFVRDAAEKVI